MAKYIALGVLAFILFVGFVTTMWIWSTYNELVTSQEAVVTQWAQVETQYQRRFDLIPNLVNATKGYLTQEQKVFGDIAEARTRYAGTPSGSDEKVQATNQMEGVLSRLLVIMENYPQLQSNQTVKDLMVELTGTENRINVARQRYNEVAQSYNVSLKVFPDNLVANVAGFKEKTYFQSETGAEKAPVVNLQ